MKKKNLEISDTSDLLLLNFQRMERRTDEQSEEEEDPDVIFMSNMTHYS